MDFMNEHWSEWFGDLSDLKFSNDMETTHKIRVEDKTKIKHIHFKFPHLMHTNSEHEIKCEYEALCAKKQELYDVRDRVRQLEKEHERMEKEWNGKKDLFDIEFESYEKEVKTTKSYMTINGKTVYDCNSRR